MPTQSGGRRVIFPILPFVFVFFIIDPPGGTGVFPVGLLIYWMTTNLWTVGQGIVTRGRARSPCPSHQALVADSSQVSRRTAPLRSRRRRAAGAEAGGTAARSQGERRKGRSAVTEELSVEATGETVGEAEVGRFCASSSGARPGLDKARSSSSGGLRANVDCSASATRRRVWSRRFPRTAPQGLSTSRRRTSELASLVRELVTHITAGMGVQCRVDVDEREDAVVLTCSGRDLGLLIGRHGQTIDAVQYLVNAILARRIPGTPASWTPPAIGPAGSFAQRDRAACSR